MAIAKSTTGAAGTLTVSPVYTVPALKRTVSNVIVHALEDVNFDISVLDAEYSYSGEDPQQYLDKSASFGTSNQSFGSGTSIYYWANDSCALSKDHVFISNRSHSRVVVKPYDNSSSLTVSTSYYRGIQVTQDGSLFVSNNGSYPKPYLRQSNGTYSGYSDLTYQVRTSNHRAFSLSPDGQHYAYTTNSSYRTAVYSYEGNGSFNLAYLINPPTGYSTSIGDAVHIDAEAGYLFVGDDEYSSGQGRVSQYDLSDGSFIRHYEASSPVGSSNFGYDISTSDDHVAISQYRVTSNYGAVDIFDKATGSHVQRLSNPTSASDYFGASLGFLSGGVLVVFSPGSSSEPSCRREYVWNGTSYQLEFSEQLTGSNGDNIGQNGMSYRGPFYLSWNVHYTTSNYAYLYTSSEALSALQSQADNINSAVSVGKLDSLGLTSGSTFERTGLVLDAGEILTLKTDGKVSVHVRGYEEDA